MTDENFIVIQGWMMNKLELKGNELILFATIYGFSQDGRSKFKGSLSYLQDALGCTRPTIIKLLKSLEEKGFIEKSVCMETGVNQYQSASKEILLGASKKSLLASKKTLPLASKKTLPYNNNIYNYNNKHNSKSSKEHNTATHIPQEKKQQRDVSGGGSGWRSGGTKEERIKMFKKEVASFLGKYKREMLKEFVEYWTESEEGKKSFRAYDTKYFDIARRLATWHKNQSKFSGNGQEKKPDRL